MKFVVRVDEFEKTVHVEHTNGIYEVQVDGKPFAVDCREFGDTRYLSMLIDNKSYLVEAAPVKPDVGKYFAIVMGRHYDLEVLDELRLAVRDAERAAEHTGDFVLTAPMPGLVVDIKVSVGDEVHVGDPVVIMEAMKMQNELTTDAAGVVKEIRVGERESVESQAPLVVIERAKD